MPITLTHAGLRFFAASSEQLVSAGVPAEIVLAAVKEVRKAEIDDEAERQRLRWITGGAGQAMTYTRKVEQARAALAAADPQLADYPLLAASIGIDGPDIVSVANVVVGMDAAWEQIGAAIESARLAAKQAIAGAPDEAAVLVVQPVWPSV
ncbi:hypothetical protein ACFPOB_30140 [Bosea eneae]|uniref:DUF4376 domain-containing protein n=1 Tax=Bosea eneae TaxID=151454 RepID=A0ABW0J217_9HYPH